MFSIIMSMVIAIKASLRYLADCEANEYMFCHLVLAWHNNFYRGNTEVIFLKGLCLCCISFAMYIVYMYIPSN